MKKGILYVTTTTIDGLIKIGKTGNFKERMRQLELDGYRGLLCKRAYAIEVDNYDEKELLLDEIFSKSRIPNTELFALDLNLVIQLLSSMEGRIIYPETESKSEVFIEAADGRQSSRIPDGIYTFVSSKYKAKMRKENGKFILLSGSQMSHTLPLKITKGWIRVLEDAKIENNVLMTDIECSSPSMASSLILHHASNGWDYWKNKEGELIKIYRQQDVDSE
jgi:hypothetical protein